MHARRRAQRSSVRRKLELELEIDRYFLEDDSKIRYTIREILLICIDRQQLYHVRIRINSFNYCVYRVSQYTVHSRRGLVSSLILKWYEFFFSSSAVATMMYSHSSID
jgi:hypothetical protein